MIFTFRFISDEEDSFVLDVNINDDQTFEELHNKIQETLDYDPSQMASFFTSNDEWEKLIEVAQMDLGDEDEACSMSKTTIGELFTEKKQNILYIFDFFAERLLFGSVSRVIDMESPIPLPSVSRFEGKVPEQQQAMHEEDMGDLDFLEEDDFGDSDDFMDMGDFEELPDDSIY